MYLLDTNIISEMRKVAIGRGNPNVAAWVSEQNGEFFYLSAIVLMELERGALGMERKDSAQGRILRTWLEQIVKKEFKTRILPVDAATAEICAKLHVPDRSPENDAWIAVQAIQHGLTLITRNEKDFTDLGVQVFNPFGA
ncbi:type II toxin-antitoxin system VapC family toxin [Neisseria perflava]|uniref:type II toxin-antitoxin system VapC family toxin n=1 Tax=Neisseria perflava TaxID=33053 RepID=UPI00209F9F9B|nr:type II toxin-antitoxin system VapC family toxin [Neisseria perflava]MCP1661241.1 putative nucleic acid-binding protein [Neisseria perflava]MCP1773272.1 putative nucleic acid-binding protein [Neisseria perflava]